MFDRYQNFSSLLTFGLVIWGQVKDESIIAEGEFLSESIRHGHWQGGNQEKHRCVEVIKYHRRLCTQRKTKRSGGSWKKKIPTNVCITFLGLMPFRMMVTIRGCTTDASPTLPTREVPLPAAYGEPVPLNTRDSRLEAILSVAGPVGFSGRGVASEL